MTHYVPIDPTKGGGVSLTILVMAMLGSVVVFGTSIFLAVYLTQQAINTENPLQAPPAPLPVEPIRVNISSEIEMALMFIQAQKAGPLPSNYPISWRGDSGLKDGQDQNRDLRGGYYTGGSNVKHHSPMAFSMTMLSWALLEYEWVFKSTPGLDEELTELIDWGVDYLLRARYGNVFFAQVGDPTMDYINGTIVNGTIQCWMRPEDMLPFERPTPYPCDFAHPCSDVAAEFAAAFAAASLVYRIGNRSYSDLLLRNAKESLAFAQQFHGRYIDSTDTNAGPFNRSTYQDEIVWAGAWLYFASNETSYLDDYFFGPRVQEWNVFKWNNTYFSWDNKWPGIQVLMSRLLLIGNGTNLQGLQFQTNVSTYLQAYHNGATQFVCSQLSMQKTAGNLMWLGTADHPLQYPIGAGFLGVLLAEYEKAASPTSNSSLCGGKANDVRDAFVIQREYILGANPASTSYMVGFFGPNLSRKSPGYVHHRAASIPLRNPGDPPLSCYDGLQYLQSPLPNPNLIYGAVVGGPAFNDVYDDDRLKREQSEPFLHVNALFVGFLAALNASFTKGNNLTRMWAAMEPGPAFTAAVNLQSRRPNGTTASGAVASGAGKSGAVASGAAAAAPRNRAKASGRKALEEENPNPLEHLQISQEHHSKDASQDHPPNEASQDHPDKAMLSRKDSLPMKVAHDSWSSFGTRRRQPTSLH